MRLIVLSLALAAFNVYAALAFLVRTYTSTSVTGQPILVCVYDYAGQQFERYAPIGSICPPSVNVY